MANPPRMDNKDKEPRKDHPADEDFRMADRTVNMIYGGPEQFESKRKQKVTQRQIVYATEPGTPEYLRWSEVPITFSRADHPGMVAKPGRYPLVINPRIRNVHLGKVLVDSGSGLNILFAYTLKEIGLCAMNLNPTHTPFFGIALGDPMVPLGQITLPITFGTIENYHIEYLRFIVADFDTAYHGILGRPALMPAPNGVITVLGNVHISYDCERENLQFAATLELSACIEEVLTASKKMASEELEILTKKLATKAIKEKPQEMKKVSLDLEDPSKTATIGANMDPK
ncbi:uncharacterized protein LOC101785440 [Setaria italica]|uniref:uncharacterized protein LOC101785440 n=1 Tax=Setaria italica TaxID=4555 RepID=UPI000BE51BB4|nr:uncharacterized protein LOC101785440 [Setaria italica]